MYRKIVIYLQIKKGYIRINLYYLKSVIQKTPPICRGSIYLYDDKYPASTQHGEVAALHQRPKRREIDI